MDVPGVRQPGVPDVREWLPEEHLAWFVIDAVGVTDTSEFYRVPRKTTAFS